jgi:hypothetical protein
LPVCGWRCSKLCNARGDASYFILVWTPCLMHRCVCIWQYILQNYNYKLHFQNLSIYHIHMMPSMDGWLYGWKKLHDHDVLYYM